ncbi:MAG: DUF6701 domain-containing protein, partial [Psychromonas sp.]
CIRVANRPFDLSLTAKRTNSETQLCENYDPTNILFWSEYIEPSTPKGLNVEINGNIIGQSFGDTKALRIDFIGGRATVKANYPDAGAIKIHVQDQDNSNIIGEVQSIINPLQLLLENIKSMDDKQNPETTDRGDGFIRASVPDYNNLAVDSFDVTVTAIKDCSNDPNKHCTGAYGKKTPSFANQIDLVPSLIFPVDGNLGRLQYDGDDGFKQHLTAGQFSYKNLAYDEVGTLGLIAKTVDDEGDDGYLLAGNHIQSSTTKSIGRFYPDYLAYGGFTAIPSCNDGFTYLGQQAIELSYSMKAYAQGGLKVTTNYDHQLGYPVANNDNFYHYAYDQRPIELTERLMPSSYYQQELWDDGQYNIVDLLFGVNRSSTPDGPYFSDNRIDYFIQLTGFDNEKIQQDSGMYCTADKCELGDLGDLAYGRLQAGNGHGSEFQPIRTGVEATYYDGNKFIKMPRDVCTGVQLNQPSKESEPTDFATETAISILNNPLINGKSYFEFSAPEKTGKLNYFVRLQSATDPLLETPWLLDTGNAVACPNELAQDCISGYVEFGLFRGNDRIIYRLQTFD